MTLKALFFSVALFIYTIPAHAGMIDYPTVKLQALDKSTARTVTFEAKVGSTIEYGSLFIKVQSCRKSEPLDKPESASFLQIWEVPLNSDKSEWAFSGWMFASSPALSAMDHAVYDVWVLDCLNKGQKSQQISNSEDGKSNLADNGELNGVVSPNEPAKSDNSKDIKETQESPSSNEADEKPKPDETPTEASQTSRTPPTQQKQVVEENSIDSVLNRAQNNE